MREKSKEKFPFKYILFPIAIIIIAVIYISYPSDTNKLSKADSFEENLEYAKKPIIERTKIEVNSTQKKEKTYTASSKNIFGEQKIEIYEPQPENLIKEPYTNIKTFSIKKSSYDRLLDDLAKNQARNINSITNIVNRLLVNLGYPQNIVEVVHSQVDQSRAKTEGTYIVANFDFSSGQINVGDMLLYKINIIETIATLAHELDHFDKLARTCKYMGIDEFENLLNKNHIQINRPFWINASRHARLTNFDGKYYKEALTRFITQNQLDLSSSYSDFYILAENMRNPLEISAYSVSDYVYQHFNIKTVTGLTKLVIEEFNKVDWALYNLISKKSTISNERIPIFDYKFMQAILKTYPNLSNEYEICKNKRNGDFTSFWLKFETNIKSFYEGKMDNQTVSQIIDLLNTTKEEIKQGITEEEIDLALKYKINTLSSNLVFHNALKILENSIISHLKYINQLGETDRNQELKNILLALNIENIEYINSKGKDLSLYYINVPKRLNDIYNVGYKKHKRFWFIYENKVFKSKLKPNQREDELLKELLLENQLKIRIEQ